MAAVSRRIALFLIGAAAMLVAMGGCDDDPDGPPACEDPICFSPNVRVNDVIEGDQINPRIAIGPEGNIYVVWQGGGIHLARSTNSAAAFEPSVRVVNDAADGSKLEPDVAVDDTGTVYAVWRDFRTPSGRIRLATSRNLGLSFEPSVPVDRVTSAAQSHPAVATISASVVGIVWMQNTGSGRDNVYYAQSVDGGQTFSIPIRVSDAAHGAHYEADPDIAVDASGNIYVVWYDDRDPGWGLYMAKSTDDGQRFHASVRVDDVPTPFNGKRQPAVAVGLAGDVYVAWHDARRGVGSFDVYFSSSRDGGQSFQPNLELSTSRSAAFYPLGITSFMAERVLVVWSGSPEDDVLLRMSTDAGQSFGDIVRVNQSGDGTQLAPAVEAGLAGEAFIAWMDSTGPDPWDVYASVATITSSKLADPRIVDLR